MAQSSLVPSPAPFPGHGEDAGLDLSGISARTEAQIIARLLSPEHDAWADTLAKVGNCAHPIRLHGTSTTIAATSGEVLGTYSSESEPLGSLHVRCGNRRASVCPSCSRLYAADTFQMIRAGVTGGKTVPESVADNPLVFATLTPPSFGHVHAAGPKGAAGGRCRPRAKSQVCEHGARIGCMQIHDQADSVVGQPICALCYDYESHVIWQWWAPELWRRFTIALRRNLAHRLGIPASPQSLAKVATVQYAKVAEYQVRGAIHFHALIRLDGPKTDAGFAPAPKHFSASMLAELIATTVSQVRYEPPAAYATDPGRVLSFGTQIDAKAVRATRRPDSPDEELSAEQVAGYLAKYATKSAADTVDTRADTPHMARLRQVCREFASFAQSSAVWARNGNPQGRAQSQYELMGKWAHMLGFRGHFSTKSRRYSITLGRLRRARKRWQTIAAKNQRAGEPLDLAALETQLLADDEDATTLVIGQWKYIGTGWQTQGDVALAKAAAARAREYAQYRAQTKTPYTKRNQGERAWT